METLVCMKPYGEPVDFINEGKGIYKPLIRVWDGKHTGNHTGQFPE